MNNQQKAWFGEVCLNLCMMTVMALLYFFLQIFSNRKGNFADSLGPRRNLGQSSRSVTVRDLMGHYDLSEDSYSQQLSDFHVNKIHCSKWRQLPCHLGMDEIVAEDIDRDCRSEEERRFKFFSRWKEMRGSDATYGSLISALLAIECRKDAESVCKLLQTSQS